MAPPRAQVRESGGVPLFQPAWGQGLEAGPGPGQGEGQGLERAAGPGYPPTRCPDPGPCCSCVRLYCGLSRDCLCGGHGHDHDPGLYHVLCRDHSLCRNDDPCTDRCRLDCALGPAPGDSGQACWVAAVAWAGSDCSGWLWGGEPLLVGEGVGHGGQS